MKAFFIKKLFFNPELRLNYNMKIDESNKIET